MTREEIEKQGFKYIRETEKLHLFKTKDKKPIVHYRFHKENDEFFHPIYEIYDDRIEIPFTGIEIKKIILPDLKALPDYISKYGYGFDDKVVSNFFSNFDQVDIKQIVISSDDSSISKDGEQLIINEGEFLAVLKLLGAERFASRQNQKRIVGNYISDTFPDLEYEFKALNTHKDLILRNLNDKLIDKLNADEIEQIGDFYVRASRKYNNESYVNRMLTGLNDRVKLLTLDNLIKKIEKYIDEDPLESVWQKLFDDFIMLFDNRYITNIDYKNIQTGYTKYPDLVLADIYGYLDFYELKRSSMNLISYDKSHKNYYLSTEASKVVAQTQNYLQIAKDNALSYANSIKLSTATEESDGLDINIINPKGIIVAGTSKELNTAKKKNDFKVLRESVNNIEFILYDELLTRLKNLRSQLET